MKAVWVVLAVAILATVQESKQEEGDPWWERPLSEIPGWYAELEAEGETDSAQFRNSYQLVFPLLDDNLTQHLWSLDVRDPASSLQLLVNGHLVPTSSGISRPRPSLSASSSGDLIFHSFANDVMKFNMRDNEWKVESEIPLFDLIGVCGHGDHLYAIEEFSMRKRGPPISFNIIRISGESKETILSDYEFTGLLNTVGTLENTGLSTSMPDRILCGEKYLWLWKESSLEVYKMDYKTSVLSLVLHDSLNQFPSVQDLSSAVLSQQSGDFVLHYGKYNALLLHWDQGFIKFPSDHTYRNFGRDQTKNENKYVHEVDREKMLNLGCIASSQNGFAEMGDGKYYIICSTNYGPVRSLDHYEPTDSFLVRLDENFQNPERVLNCGDVNAAFVREGLNPDFSFPQQGSPVISNPFFFAGHVGDHSPATHPLHVSVRKALDNCLFNDNAIWAKSSGEDALCFCDHEVGPVCYGAQCRVDCTDTCIYTATSELYKPEFYPEKDPHDVNYYCWCDTWGYAHSTIYAPWDDKVLREADEARRSELAATLEQAKYDAAHPPPSEAELLAIQTERMHLAQSRRNDLKAKFGKFSS